MNPDASDSPSHEAPARRTAPGGRRRAVPAEHDGVGSENSARVQPPNLPAQRRPDELRHAPAIDPDGARTVQIGTALWAAALLMLLPFYGWLAEAGRLWWLWVCCAGLGLGLIGIDVCRQRRDRTGGASATLTAPPSGGGRRRR